MVSLTSARDAGPFPNRVRDRTPGTGGQANGFEIGALRSFPLPSFGAMPENARTERSATAPSGREAPLKGTK